MKNFTIANLIRFSVKLVNLTSLFLLRNGVVQMYLYYPVELLDYKPYNLW